LAHGQPNSVDPKPIKQINEIAIKELGFKVAVLDLKEIHTYHKNERNINEVLDDREIIHKIIREHVDHERWFKLPEVRRVTERTYPGTISTYARRQSEKWSLVNTEEIT
jgi:hypothetical protein